MFKALRNRFLVLNLSLICVLMVAAFGIIYAMTATNVARENERRLMALQAFQASPATAFRPGWTLTERRTMSELPPEVTFFFSLELDAQGNILYRNSILELSDELYLQAARSAVADERPSDTLTLEGRRWLYAKAERMMASVTYDPQRPHVVYAVPETTTRITFLDVTESHRALMNLITTFLIVGTLMLSLIFCVSLLFANRAIRPIAAAWEKQRQFVADASHELKTPLAIISANADALLQSGEESVNSQCRWVDYIKAETARMGDLVASLLCLARSEDTPKPGALQAFDVSALAGGALLSMEAMAFERGLLLSSDIEPDVLALGDPQQVQQVAVILLDNALKYTAEGGSVALRVRRLRRQAVLSVRNTAQVDKKDLPRLFDRFYRADPSRARASGGFGLGLPIARSIMERLGGTLTAEAGDGAITFAAYLPLSARGETRSAPPAARSAPP